MPDLHFALGHMRRWDGAYPALANGTKAVDLLCTEAGKERFVLFAQYFVWEHIHDRRIC